MQWTRSESADFWYHGGYRDSSLECCYIPCHLFNTTCKNGFDSHADNRCTEGCTATSVNLSTLTTPS